MITVSFENFGAMVQFAKQVVGGLQQPVPATPESVAPKKWTRPAEDERVGLAAGQATMPISTPKPTAEPAPVPMQPFAAQPSAAQVFSTQQPVPTPQPTAPQAAQQPAPAPSIPTGQMMYTLDDLARAALPLMDAGKLNELQGLLGQFGVASMPELNPAQYGAFATGLRQMGAQI